MVYRCRNSDDENIAGLEIIAMTRIAQLDRLGQLLLAPLAAHLGQQIYLLPAGLLDGFPFDLLRVDRHYLAQRAQTVNLMSLAALEHRRLSLEAAEQHVSLNRLVSNKAELMALLGLFAGDGRDREVIGELLRGAGVKMGGAK